jgi:hypothetical protein
MILTADQQIAQSISIDIVHPDFVACGFTQLCSGDTEDSTLANSRIDGASDGSVAKYKGHFTCIGSTQRIALHLGKRIIQMPISIAIKTTSNR